MSHESPNREQQSIQAAVVHRRWFRFSIRTSLLVLTALAIWLAYHVDRVRRQESAIAELQKIGAQVSYDVKTALPSWVVQRIGEKHFRTVTSVSLAKTPATDEHVQWLAAFPRLTHLVLNDSGITDSGMRHLRNLKKLTWLELERTGIGDDGVAILHKHDKLVTLRLTGTEVSREGIERISNLSHTLKELWIEQTNLDADDARTIKPSWPDTRIICGAGEEVLP